MMTVDDLENIHLSRSTSRQEHIRKPSFQPSIPSSQLHSAITRIIPQINTTEVIATQCIWGTKMLYNTTQKYNVMYKNSIYVIIHLQIIRDDKNTITQRENLKLQLLIFSKKISQVLDGYDIKVIIEIIK